MSSLSAIRFFKACFVDHPTSAGETYWQHLYFTITMAFRFFKVACAILIHGLIPCLFVRTASTEIIALYEIMKARVPSKTNTEEEEDVNVPITIHPPKRARGLG